MPNDNKRVPYFEAKQSFNVQDSAFFLTKGRRNNNMQNLILLFEKSFGNSFVQSLTKKKPVQKMFTFLSSDIHVQDKRASPLKKSYLRNESFLQEPLHQNYHHFRQSFLVNCKLNKFFTA